MKKVTTIKSDILKRPVEVIFLETEEELEPFKNGINYMVGTDYPKLGDILVKEATWFICSKEEFERRYVLDWKVVSSISYEPIEEPKSINYPKPKMSMLQKLMIQELIKDERNS